MKLTQEPHLERSVKLRNLSMAAQSKPTGANASMITNSIPPLEPTARLDWIDNKKRPAGRFAIASKKAGCIPDLEDKRHIEQMQNTELLLNLLENDTQMSPQLNRSAGIETWLAMFNKPEFHFPEDIKQRAQNLLQRFQAENWGAQAAAAMANSSNSDSAEEVASPATPTATTAPAAPAASGNAVAIVMYFPANHRIYGVNGIMRGILLSKHKSYPLTDSCLFCALGDVAGC